MKIDLDDIERVATGDMQLGCGPMVTLALVARIRELEEFLRLPPDADKVSREDFPGIFSHLDGNALYVSEARRRLLEKGAVLP